MSIPKTKVLVVQDFYASLNAIVYVLRQTGLHGIVTATDGNTALRKLQSDEYGIVISDWHMKGIDGLSLLKKVREDESLKDLIFIMVTSENDREKVVEAKECGVDGYVMKPFTAELLCKRLVASLRARYPEMHKQAQRQPAGPSVLKSGGPRMKIFGQAAADIGTAPPQSWSISLSHFDSKKQPVVKDNLTAAMRLLSRQFDMMKTDPGFVPVADMLGKVEAIITNTEKQAESAGRIADAADDMDRAIEAVKNAPGGSPEFERGMTAIDSSAAELSDMIDSFDREVEDVIGVLNGMEHMVRQAHIHEINESIRVSCDIEMGRTEEVSEGISDIPAEVAGRLSLIQSGSEAARETLTRAAGGLANVIEQIDDLGQPGRPSLDLLKKLRSRIDHIMDSLDNQVALAASLVTGMNDVSSVKKEVVESMEPITGEPAGASAPSPKQPGAPPARSGAAQSAFKKVIKNRILMIDVIRKDHMLCIDNLEDYLNTGSDTGFRPEQLPGSPSCGLSKWIERRLEQQDFHDPEVCRQIALLRDDVYASAGQALKLFGESGKAGTLKSFEKTRELSRRIDVLLSELQENLRKQI